MIGIFLALALAAGAAPVASPLAPDMSGLSFLLGKWSSGSGKVPEIGGTSVGRSMVTAEAGGQVMLRRDHVDLFVDGKPHGGFDQLMIIYPEGGTLHADYSDGTHMLHYTRAAVLPGRSVSFMTAEGGEAPVFKLLYEAASPTSLAVSFSMAAPHSTVFKPIASGVLLRTPPAD